MYNLCSSIYKYLHVWIWSKIHLAVDKRQINPSLMLYWWYLYGMDEIWKTAKRFYDQTESKTYLYKLPLKIFLQANRVPKHFSLYRSTKSTTKHSLPKNQNFFNAKSEHPYSLKKYSLQPSTSNSTNMLHIPIILQSLYQTYWKIC